MEPGIAAEIVENDKIDIDASDVVLVMYDKPSIGTSMEILYAWERGKRIVIVCRPETRLSPWLIYHSHGVEHSLAAACEVLASSDAPTASAEHGPR
jgi:nucleoside 2-deoxyribosyltransferase